MIISNLFVTVNFDQTREKNFLLATSSNCMGKEEESTLVFGEISRNIIWELWDWRAASPILHMHLISQCKLMPDFAIHLLIGTMKILGSS